jgi:hypothetical protein
LEPLWVFSTSYYLGLIGEIPTFRAEKWAMVRKNRSDQTYWPDSMVGLEGLLLLYEGRLAETVSLLKKEQPFKGGPYNGSLPFYTALTYLGEFDWDYSNVDKYQFWGFWALLPESFDFPVRSCPAPSARMHRTIPLSSCSYVNLLLGEVDKARELLEDNLSGDFEEFDNQFRHTYFYKFSIGITMATVYTLDNQTERAAIYGDLIEKLLISVSENYQLESVWLARTRAYLHALRGEDEQAIGQLSSAIDMGERDFSVFMHPAFNNIRNNPRFVALLEHWMELINEERLKLGLTPRELNYATGPGVIPFKSQEPDSLPD